jgi:drug/metabolite transporter (DMT)-like permease
MAGPGTPRDILLLLMLASAWGGSFVLIKLSVATLPPLTMTAVRLLLAALILGAVARAFGHRFPSDWRTWRFYLLFGLSGTVVPFSLIAFGEIRIDSAMAAILIAAVPLATHVLSHFFVAGERLGKVTVVGILIGFSGVVVLFGPGALAGLGSELVGQLAILAATLSYAISNVLASRLRHLPPMVNGAATLFAASVWALPASLIIDRPWTLDPSLSSILALLMLALISTAAANLIYFLLITSAGPSFLSLTNFLVPVMGVFWSWLFLAEHLGWEALAALALILAGIAVVRYGRRRRQPASPSTSAIE